MKSHLSIWKKIHGKALPETLWLFILYIADCHHRQRFIESRDIPETENTLGLDGGEAKFYVYIQSTTMERPDLERTMEQVLPYGKSIT